MVARNPFRQILGSFASSFIRLMPRIPLASPPNMPSTGRHRSSSVVRLLHTDLCQARRDKQVVANFSKNAAISFSLVGGSRGCFDCCYTGENYDANYAGEPFSTVASKEHLNGPFLH